MSPNHGDAVIRYMEPGRETFSSDNVSRAECQYKNGSKAPLTITIEGTAWQCPFPTSQDAKCEQTIAKAQFGDFDLKRKH
jgi:hypothetical protein